LHHPFAPPGANLGEREVKWRIGDDMLMRGVSEEGQRKHEHNNNTTSIKRDEKTDEYF
jgi:hypothetical protein